MKTNGKSGFVRSSGNQKKAGRVDNCLDVFEQKMQRSIMKKSKPLHYDELCRFGNAGFVYNKTKAVRNQDGKLDIYRTFRRAYGGDDYY